MSKETKKLNKNNDICNGCGSSTVPIFGTGRASWCPKCESIKPEKKETTNKKVIVSSDENNPYGFHIIEVDNESEI